MILSYEMNYKWQIRQQSEEELQAISVLSKELTISPLSARILVDRGIRTREEASNYVHPSIDNLHDPYLMKDMDKAVERIEKALAQHEKILIYGDYDVDGTTAVALMYTFLKQLTDNLDFYIPDRYTEGYGISYKGIDYAEAEGCTLIIALDCGIKAMDKVRYATEKNIDFIICDHHEPAEVIPAAVAVLDIKRGDCTYPFKDLSGCGVGFKLTQAYAIKHHMDAATYLNQLPFLAMSIASDVVSVVDENRILEYYGLQQINKCPSVGLAAIIEVAGLSGKVITMSDLLFKIGPRINACGRLYTGKEAVLQLITEDPCFAAEQARNINSYNAERKGYDNQVTEEALTILREDPDNDLKHTTVVYSPTWHKGVVGIAASRLTESYYRPTIVLTAGENGIISGSARSVSDFDLYAAIDSCRDLLTNFGGHKFAAGLSMRIDDLPAFKQRFEAYVAAHITPEQQQSVLRIEAEIDLADITPQFMAILKHLEPFGPGNERPVFLTRHLINNRYTRAVGQNKEHLHLDVTDGTAAIEGIAFGRGDMALYLQNGNPADICYELGENTFNHHTTTQLMVHDIKTNSN